MALVEVVIANAIVNKNTHRTVKTWLKITIATPEIKEASGQ
jgi:hypothetical protein